MTDTAEPAPDRAELCRLFKEAITRQWGEVARYVMDDVLRDVIDCHLDLVARATADLRADCQHHSDDADQWSDRATAAEAALARALTECAAIDHLHLYGQYDATHICRTIAARIRAALDPPAGDTTGGTAVLTVVVTAPTQENAHHWAATLRDLLQAEHGDEMRLHMTITPAPAGQPKEK